MLTSLLVALTLLAQSTAVKIDINTNKGGGGTMWYSTWWFWVLVGLFALIVIIAITSRSRGTVVQK